MIREIYVKCERCGEVIITIFFSSQRVHSKETRQDKTRQESRARLSSIVQPRLTQKTWALSLVVVDFHISSSSFLLSFSSVRRNVLFVVVVVVFRFSFD